MNRRKLTILISGAIVVLAVGLSSYWLWTKRPTAHEVSLPTSYGYLRVSIINRGQPAIGKLLIGGDCPDDELASQDGTFTCKLSVVDGFVNLDEEEEFRAEPSARLDYLHFYSFEDDQVYTLPIQHGQATEGAPVLIPAGENLNLRAIISAEGQVTVEAWNGEGFEPFPPPE